MSTYYNLISLTNNYPLDVLNGLKKNTGIVINNYTKAMRHHIV